MRPLISWADLPGRRVGVWGPAGVEGQANLRKLAALGITPAALVDDSPPPTPSPASAAPAAPTDKPGGVAEAAGRAAGWPPVLATADGGLAALASCDVVIKAPGISRYREDARWLADQGVVIAGGLGLWLAGLCQPGWADGQVIAITGTKGKSSTTAIAGHLLTRLGYPTVTGGNIGRAPYDPDLPGPPPRYWVIEVSSYQATDLPVSAPVTAVTSLHPDHLPWHGGVEQYYADKLSACHQPGAEVTVANGDSDLLRERAALLGPRVEWVSADDDPGADWMAPLGLLGAHSRRNALIARACLRAAGVPEASDDDALRAAAAGFAPLASRLQVIGTAGGVTFVDDSLSTNVLPTLAAVGSFPGRRIALIAGGQDRGIDYAPLAAGLHGRDMPLLVLALDQSGPRIQAAIEAGRPGKVEVTACPDLAAAVRQGFQWARPDGVVLLSPAAASFGTFRNYADRAAAFGRAMRACTGGLDPAG